MDSGDVMNSELEFSSQAKPEPSQSGSGPRTGDARLEDLPNPGSASHVNLANPLHLPGMLLLFCFFVLFYSLLNGD